MSFISGYEAPYYGFLQDQRKGGGVKDAIAVVGSLNADLVARVARAPEAGETLAGRSFTVFNGGKGANQAYAAARLGGRVNMFGRVGDDDYGRAQIANLDSANVGVKLIRLISGTSTGIAIITVEDSAENRIIVIPGANGAYTADELHRDLGLFRDARFALFQLETPLETVALGLKEARRAGMTTLLDPAPAMALPDPLLRNVDYLTPNLSELRILSGMESLDAGEEDAVVEAARRLIQRGVGKVLTKLGPSGALLASRREVVRFPGYTVEAVDTTAAGDCFNAAFAVALADGKTEGDAGRFACAAAACSVTRSGAQSSMPSLEDVRKLLEVNEPQIRPQDKSQL